MGKKIETPEEKNRRELVEGIAKNLKELTVEVKKLLNGPLKRKTLLVLLANSSGLSQSVVSQVLNSIETLDKDWLN